MKVLFLTPYPAKKAPSQRFRFEQYLGHLEANGIACTENSFLSDSTWQILYKEGHAIQKVLGILTGFIRRFLMLFTAGAYDYIFIHREASPIGPPVFEFLLSRVLKKRIIYDFDDAIWLSNTSKANKMVDSLKWSSKVGSICAWAHTVCCGNDYLANYAKSFNTNVVVLPTSVDMMNHHKGTIPYNREKPVIGWTGTHSTIKYLSFLIPILQELEKRMSFTFMVISNKKPEYELNSLVYKEWNKETEIADLLKFDYGVMPLVADKWSEGKCGFKALQYMSLGIPTILSPVGVNALFAKNSNGVVAVSTKEEWKRALEEILAASEDKRMEMGSSNQAYVQNNYSVEANKSKYLALFQ